MGLWMTVLPLFIIVSAIVCEYSGLDIWWESFFFNESTHSWPFRDHWLFEQVLHEGGRLFNIFAAGLWLLGFITTLLHKPFRKYRKPMLYFLVAAAAGPIIVGALKQATHIYTPWDILPFYGSLPYIRLFDLVPNGLPIGQAFPAGHASGGYTFFSLYFLMHQLGASDKKLGLAAGLFLGGAYGLGQQVRGAHFPSHDLFSMVICWYAAFYVYYLFYPKQWRGLFNGSQHF
ncbi:PAP2 family protein [Desulfobacter hydrogenophilus]|uniref:PAP2 family protein n=3 Tax=Desulfobacter hydrogenophilus TaxID=2291 RepID=A0A328F9W0_9BACT|nr:phosphatase PAP2 family protein [Desulfobacter hydrogenophilus]QBH15585.1 phosphatase PAP2 family protein [Desulfobacter hydrogenophilus]RAM01159.1 PAP2 family protein [Desulfobacter hydrogenophilus]